MCQSASRYFVLIPKLSVKKGLKPSQLRSMSQVHIVTLKIFIQIRKLKLISNIKFLNPRTLVCNYRATVLRNCGGFKTTLTFITI